MVIKEGVTNSIFCSATPATKKENSTRTRIMERMEVMERGALERLETLAEFQVVEVLQALLRIVMDGHREIWR